MNEPYPVDEEYYYSMSRDVSEQERGRVSIHWWEIIIYLSMLAIAFILTLTIIK